PIVINRRQELADKASDATIQRHHDADLGSGSVAKRCINVKKTGAFGKGIVSAQARQKTILYSPAWVIFDSWADLHCHDRTVEPSRSACLCDGRYVDRAMTADEFARIGEIVSKLPVFADCDEDGLVKDCRSLR